MKKKLTTKDGVKYRRKRTVMFVDPPSGWRHGFPCEWDQEKETFEELLRRKGYPERDFELAKTHSRCWYEEVEL